MNITNSGPLSLKVTLNNYNYIEGPNFEYYGMDSRMSMDVSVLDGGFDAQEQQDIKKNIAKHAGIEESRIIIDFPPAEDGARRRLVTAPPPPLPLPADGLAKTLRSPTAATSATPARSVTVTAPMPASESHPGTPQPGHWPLDNDHPMVSLRQPTTTPATPAPTASRRRQPATLSPAAKTVQIIIEVEDQLGSPAEDVVTSMRTAARNANSELNKDLESAGLTVVSTTIIPAIGQMDKITPERGPLTGETKVKLDGAILRLCLGYA